MSDEVPAEPRSAKSRFAFAAVALLFLGVAMLVAGPPQIRRRVVSDLPSQTTATAAPHGTAAPHATVAPGGAGGSSPASSPGPAATTKPGGKTSASPGAGPTPATTGENRCDNNLLAQNINGWGSLDDTAATRDPIGDLTGAAWAFRTAGSQFYLPKLDVVAGQHWVLAARSQVLNTSGTAQIAVQWYNAADTMVGAEYGPKVKLADTTEGSGRWATLTNIFTVPYGTVSAHVLQAGSFGTTSDTGFRSTLCDYRLSTATPSVNAAVRYGWGSPDASQSDEYTGDRVDLSKWGLFGAPAGQRSGCAPGYQGNGQRCGSQTTQSGGYLHVSGLADGRTGGMYSQMPSFRYGRVEIRQRSVALADNGGATYRTVPLLWPENGDDYEKAEIDFAERELNTTQVHLFAHHGDGQAHCRTAINPAKFHTFAVDWRPGTISWYVDGALICTVAATITSYNSSNGGAQMDMFARTGTLMRPARQDVDWIRMYRNKYTDIR